MSKKNSPPSVSLEEVPKTDLEHSFSDPSRPVVMVVDDESRIADTLAEILSRSGYTALATYDGDSALETALINPPAMLIADVVLPGMSGIDLAIKIKRIYPDCKVILFSGQATTADLLAAANREGHQFVLLNKPVHPGDLLARVSDILAHRKLQPVAMQ